MKADILLPFGAAALGLFCAFGILGRSCISARADVGLGPERTSDRAGELTRHRSSDESRSAVLAAPTDRIRTSQGASIRTENGGGSRVSKLKPPRGVGSSSIGTGASVSGAPGGAPAGVTSGSGAGFTTGTAAGVGGNR